MRRQNRRPPALNFKAARDFCEIAGETLTGLEYSTAAAEVREAGRKSIPALADRAEACGRGEEARALRALMPRWNEVRLPAPERFADTEKNT